MYSFIELLRAIAVLLITNSHFDGVYPINISWGGCPGVALFFTISGFLLVRGVGKEGFVSWWLKKVIRLYISLTMVNIISLVIGFRKASLSLFFFPVNDNFWYVPVISILYIIYFFVIDIENNLRKPAKMKWGGVRMASVMVTVIFYVILYLLRYRDEFFVEPEIIFRALYGFMAMMLGSFVYDKKEVILQTGKGFIFLCLSIFSCGGFLSTKLLMERFDVVMKLQFMTQVFSVAFAFFALLAGLCYEEEIKSFMAAFIGKIMGIISKCSLEIYLIQFLIIAHLRSIVFPVNLISILFTVVLAGRILNKVSNYIYLTVMKIIFNKN